MERYRNSTLHWMSLQTDTATLERDYVEQAKAVSSMDGYMEEGG